MTAVTTEAAAIGLVVVLLAVRLWAGPTALSIRFAAAWGAARQQYMPLVDGYAKRIAGVSAENSAEMEEYVLEADVSIGEAVRRLQRGSERHLEVSVLSGLKTDWEGNPEVASVVGYHGPKPAPWLPDVARRYQVHVTIMRLPDGTLRVTAHREANSWRPDLWKDHLFKGPSFDARDGVETAIDWWMAGEA